MPAAADGDGRLDMRTNYEWSGILRLAFGPPASAARQPWPAVSLGRVPNAESSCFGDLDVAANCEEFDRWGRVFLAVVWFENPGL